MTRADLIGEIAGRTGYSKAIVKTVIEEFFLVVKESLLHRISVQIRGFGSFFPKRRASKKARNIGKGITIYTYRRTDTRVSPNPAERTRS